MATEKGIERRLKRRRELIAERFKEGLERKRLNQVQFAKLADMRVSFVNRVLQAEANLTLQTICNLEETLGYDLISIPQVFDEKPSLEGSGRITGKRQ
jgi:transcriptional regulator with XRE-family HTH domain